MEHGADSGFGLGMIGDNPLLILAVIFGVGGWLIYSYAMSGATDVQSPASESSESRRER
jgi:hypothetical protein